MTQRTRCGHVDIQFVDVCPDPLVKRLEWGPLVESYESRAATTIVADHPRQDGDVSEPESIGRVA